MRKSLFSLPTSAELNFVNCILQPSAMFYPSAESYQRLLRWVFSSLFISFFYRQEAKALFPNSVTSMSILMRKSVKDIDEWKTQVKHMYSGRPKRLKVIIFKQLR